MKNPNAIKLVAAAAKYRDSIIKNSMYADSAKVAQQDYEDLVSIAQMIENNEDGIARAMWKLDTAVRDVIPDSVYNTFNK
jgi:predicted ATPase